LLESHSTFPPLLYRETALKVMQDNAVLPSILGVHVAAVIGRL